MRPYTAMTFSRSDARKNAYFIQVREICWKICRKNVTEVRKGFKGGTAIIFPGGFPPAGKFNGERAERSKFENRKMCFPLDLRVVFSAFPFFFRLSHTFYSFDSFEYKEAPAYNATHKKTTTVLFLSRVSKFKDGGAALR